MAVMHAVLLAALVPGAAVAADEPLAAGAWRAVLQSPGGELPFGLQIQQGGDMLRAWIVNGSEELEIPEVAWREGRLELALPHYASRLLATPSADGATLTGEWLVDRGGSLASMAFVARAGDAPRFAVTDDAGGAAAAADAAASVAASGTGTLDSAAQEAQPITGRWAAQFAGDADPSVGVFEQHADGTLTGTFLTTTGDYRWLAGDARAAPDAPPGSGLRLSCFDGAHAFLFTARLLPDGTLAGDFWSRDNFHDTFTARRDAEAALPDAFDQVHWRPGARLDDVAFPDLDGVLRSLADPAFAGKARVVQVFGSWCPNCADEASYLVELQQRYGKAGLSIVGLAFERSGDFARDAAQVRRYAARHGVTWPLLVAGVADKQRATATLGLLDRVKSFPTTIFLHGDGRVAAVHSGYAGPATGAAHAAQRRQFEGLIETLLAE